MLREWDLRIKWSKYNASAGRKYTQYLSYIVLYSTFLAMFFLLSAKRSFCTPICMREGRPWCGNVLFYILVHTSEVQFDWRLGEFQSTVYYIWFGYCKSIHRLLLRMTAGWRALLIDIHRYKLSIAMYENEPRQQHVKCPLSITELLS